MKTHNNISLVGDGLMRIVFVIMSLFVIPAVSAQLPDGETRISLLTCTPGPDLYSVFGHSAIRVEGRIQNRKVDWVYNYGTFQFDDSFYLKFARGKLDYMLSKSDFADFQYEYIYTGRGIFEQVLKLDSAQKVELIRLLEENYKPENRTYRYHFFYDNCSTRIRDIVNKASGGNVHFTYTYGGEYTFRHSIQKYLDYMPWSDFGIDLALGMPCDRVMQKGDAMFLPDSLMNEFNYAGLGDSSLTYPADEILPAEFELTPSGFFTPMVVFISFLIVHVVLGLYLAKRKKLFQFTDRTILFVTGLLGLLIVFLWFFTDHTTTKWNLNIIWANPLNLILAFVLPSRKSKFVNQYLHGYFLILVLFLAGWFFIPQSFNTAILPIIFAVLFTIIKLLYPNVITSKSRQKV